ncbi:MAG: GLUG motif-containing protein, partial [Oscillospiraceae bacterium]
MSKKLKRPIAFIATLAMILSMLLYLPSGVMTDIGFGLAVSAEDVTGTTSGEGNTPADTGTTDGTGDPTAGTNSTPDSTDEGAAVESEPVMLLAASAATAITPSQPTGDGSVGSPYQIGTAAELYWFAAQVNSGSTTINAVLKADITVNTGVLNTNGSFTSWTPIGNDSNIYTGTFNGNGKTISGLYFDDGNTWYVGLFGYVGSDGNVSNVGIVDSYFNGKNYVGGVCGYNSGTIQNCYNTGAVSGGNSVGGVCGYNSRTITNCYFDSNNYGEDAVGYKSGTITDVAGKTTNAFEKGEVCYLLQSGQEKDSGSGEAPMVWGQTIGIDKAPVLTSDSTKIVYRKTTGCIPYSNNKSETIIEHSYSGTDFRCTVCGSYETPVFNNDVYEISNASQLYWFAEYVNNGN